MKKFLLAFMLVVSISMIGACRNVGEGDIEIPNISNSDISSDISSDSSSDTDLDSSDTNSDTSTPNSSEDDEDNWTSFY